MGTPRMSVEPGPFGHKHAEVQSQKYVVFADTDRRFIDCSDEVCELLGYRKDEIVAKTIDDLSYVVSDVPAVFDRFVRSGSLDGQYLLRHRSGRPVLIRYSAYAFADGCLAAVWEPAEPWRQLYYAALLELDPTRRRIACKLALEAIANRRLRTAEDGSGSSESDEEMARLVDRLYQELRML